MKVNDVCVVISNGNGHWYEIGEIVIVSSVVKNNRYFHCIGNARWGNKAAFFLHKDEVVKIGVL